MSLFSQIKKKIKELKKISWVKSFNFNFGDTTNLAIMQDKLIEEYKNGLRQITAEQMFSLENNPWIAMANKLAPNNLVIRQYCLIDLFRGRPEKINTISKLLKILSYNSKIWAEGYTYWLYTRMALDLWMEAFKDTTIKTYIDGINLGFLRTSYFRAKKWYPALFGDLREGPIEDQTNHVPIPAVIGPVSFQVRNNSYVYVIKAIPIGLNTHIPKDDYAVTVEDKTSIDFKFYQGYDKKYKNKAEEWADTLSIKRIKSIPDRGFLTFFNHI